MFCRLGELLGHELAGQRNLRQLVRQQIILVRKLVQKVTTVFDMIVDTCSHGLHKPELFVSFKIISSAEPYLVAVGGVVHVDCDELLAHGVVD